MSDQNRIKAFRIIMPFYKLGIESLKYPIPFFGVGLRLLICQSLYRDWDREIGGVTVIETGIKTLKGKESILSRLFERS